MSRVINLAELRARTLLFLHIHKTAGTTLHRIIESQYNPFRIYTIEGRWVEWSLRHFQSLPESRRAQFKVIKGHMNFGLHTAVPRPSTYITFLRDPIARSLSSYRYAKGNPMNAFHKRIMRENLGVGEFLDLTPWNNNLQCKVLAGLTREQFRPIEVVKKVTRIGAPAPAGEIDSWSNRETLERAKANLESYFSFVGIVEKFDESLAVLKHLFAWNLSSYSMQRKSSPDVKPDETTRREIEKHNLLDQELYTFATELFEKLVGSLAIDIEMESAALRFEMENGLGETISRLGRAAASRIASIF